MEESEPKPTAGWDLMYGYSSLEIKISGRRRAAEDLVTLYQRLGRRLRKGEGLADETSWILDAPIVTVIKGCNIVQSAAELEAATSSFDDCAYNDSHRCSFFAPWLQKTKGNARAHVKSLVEELRSASTLNERRIAVREFLAALAEMIARLLHFLVRALILLLSQLLGSVTKDDAPAWRVDPIAASPQIAPRGPNHAFPVLSYWGGRHRSASGSAVLAA